MKRAAHLRAGGRHEALHVLRGVVLAWGEQVRPNTKVLFGGQAKCHQKRGAFKSLTKEGTPYRTLNGIRNRAFSTRKTEDLTKNLVQNVVTLRLTSKKDFQHG